MNDSAPQPVPVEMPPERPFHSVEVLEARRAAARRRAVAMCMDHDLVAGMRLRALTPATYSMLCAIESPFVYGLPASSGDVRTYVWLHSERYTLDPMRAEVARAAVLADLDRNILPRWRCWRLSRAARHTMIAAGYAIAAARIAEGMEVAFADDIPGDGTGKRVGAALEAQLLHVFSTAYRFWPLPTPVSHTPIRKLYQLMRTANGSDFDPVEASAIERELEADNREAIARAKAQKGEG